MAFLRVNGLEISAQVAGFGLNDESVDNYSRSVSDSMEGITYSVKKNYEFETVPLQLDEAHALEGWLRGIGHLWSFSRRDPATTRFTRTSADAGLILSSGTVATDAVYGSHALMVLSAATSTATASFGAEGDWSIFGYQKVGTATYSSYAVRSRNGVVEAFQAGASVATVRFVALSASSGYLGMALLGRNNAGSSATALYDNVAMVPYALTDSMVTSLASCYYGMPTTGPAKPPFVTITGDALQRGSVAVNEVGERGGQSAKGYVIASNPIPVSIDGGFRYNARTLEVRLVEK